MVDEYIYIYDSPSPNATRYTLADFRFNVNAASHYTSSRGGFVIFYDDRSTGTNGKGIAFEAHIQGMVGK